MADLRIEKKENKSILPWLLGLLVLGLAIWGIAELIEEDPIEGMADTEVIDGAADRGSEIVKSGSTYTLIDLDDPAAGDRFDDLYTEYETYTANMTGEMGLDHEFSHDALTYLADATRAIAMEYDVELNRNLTEAKQLADGITVDPYADNHADMIRRAALNITEMLERIDKWALDGLAIDEVRALRREAEDINAATLTLDQKEDVRGFFRAARAVLLRLP